MVMRTFLRAMALAGLCVGSHARGDFFLVSSLNADEVLRYDADTGVYQGVWIAPGTGGLDAPHGYLVRDSDVLLCSWSNAILRFDRASGAFLGTFADAGSGLSLPVCLARGPDGNVYVTSQGSDEVLRYADDGTAMGAFVAAGSGGIDGPSGLAFAPDGRLYVAGRYSANLIAYDDSTGALIGVVADAGDGLGSGDTFGLALAPNGDLYLASNGAVRRFDRGTGMFTATISTGFPIGVEAGTFGGAGQALVASSNNIFLVGDDDALTGPLLSGGSLSTLNFFVRLPDLCAADLDGDNDTDVFDFGVFAASFGGSVAPGMGGDLDGSGFVDVFDFAMFASEFGCGG